MKQFFTFKWLIMSLMLVMGAGHAWAVVEPDVTYDFTGSDWTVSDGTLSNGTVSMTGEGGANFKMNSGYFILGKSGAYLNLPAFSFDVEKIEVVGRSGASGSVKQNIYVGDVAVSTETTGATGTNTYEIATGYQAAGTNYTLKVTSAHNTQITSIKIYKKAVTSPLASIAVDYTNAPTSFYVGDAFSHEGAEVTATYEDDNTADVTASATFSDPDMTTAGTKEVTVSYTEGEVTKTTTYNITVSTRTLSSISLSGDYPTTFQQNGTFSYDGLVVTATYDDTSTKDVTADASVTVPDLTTTGQKEVTVSYTEGGVTKTDTYEVTVTEVPWNVKYDFSTIEGFSSWGTGYSERAINYSDATVTFSSACKQTVTITDVPVTKGNEVSVVLKNTDDSFNYVEFNCRQWGSKAQTITLHYSTDGGDNYTSTGITSTNFKISSNSLPSGTNAVKITFSSTDNQVGIESFAFKLNPSVPKYTLTFVADPVDGGVVTVLDEYNNSVTTGSRFEEDELLDVYATANTGYTFSGWTVVGITLTDEEKAENNILFEMPANEVTLTAGFTLNSHELLVSGNNGTYAVTVDGAAWNGTDEILYGSNVEVTATANSGYGFTSWTTDLNVADKTANTISFTMPDDDVVLEANFADLSVECTILYYVGGVEYSVTRSYDEELNLTSPAAINGMTFVGWSESDEITSNPTFVSNSTAVKGDMILYAIFAAQQSPSYVKQQTSGDVESGDYLIVYETGSVAFDGSRTTLDAANNTIGVTITENTIESNATTDAAVFTYDATEHTLKSASGYYIGVSSASNGLKQSTESSTYSNTISIDESGNVVVFGYESGSDYMTLRFNKGSNDNRFRYYKNNGQQAIQLYKKTFVTSGYSLAVPEKVTITSAKYATYSSAQPLNFSETGITVYKAKVDNGVVKLTEVEDGIVPANTGVILYKSTPVTDQEVPAVATSASLSDNELVATVERTLVKKVGDDGNFNYILQKSGDNIVFNIAKVDGAYMPAGRAYLSTSYEAPSTDAPLRVEFGNGQATSIDSINTDRSEFMDGTIYNLSGQRVTSPQRGIYIVNGKKVYVK